MAAAAEKANPFFEKVKSWAAFVTAGAVLMGLLNTAAGLLLIDPVLAAIDERHDNRYVSLDVFDQFLNRFGRYEMRQNCQTAESERDQTLRLLNRAKAENVHEDILKDYQDQYDKYARRYDEWKCDDILEMTVTPP